MEKPTILICVSGGVVQSVQSDQEVRVILADADIAESGDDPSIYEDCCVVDFRVDVPNSFFKECVDFIRE